MGRQVNFYLSDKDQEALLYRLVERFDIGAIMPPIMSPPAKVENLLRYARRKGPSYDPTIVRKSDWHQLTYRFVGGVVNGYFVDDERSPVIDFKRCMTRGKKIVRGRFYCIPYYYDTDGQRIEKPAEFLRFAEQMFGVARRFCKSAGHGKYVGPEADAMSKRGFELVEALT